jgi:pilus biogenesis lipoprotein CpaD
MKHLAALYRLVCPLLALVPLAACMGTTQQQKQPVITYTPITHDVFYTANMVLPTNAEEANLMAFLDESAHNPDGNITLLTSTISEPVTQERLSDIRQLIKGQGHETVIAAPDPLVPANRIRVRASKVEVHAPDCPDWTYSHMANYRNTVLSNYGCAHATNLSKMVLDPNDLITGKGDASPDATRGSGVIEVYRTPAEPATTGGESQIQGQ